MSQMPVSEGCGKAPVNSPSWSQGSGGRERMSCKVLCSHVSMGCIPYRAAAGPGCRGGEFTVQTRPLTRGGGRRLYSEPDQARHCGQNGPAHSMGNTRLRPSALTRGRSCGLRSGQHRRGLGQARLQETEGKCHSQCWGRAPRWQCAQASFALGSFPSTPLPFLQLGWDYCRISNPYLRGFNPVHQRLDA